MTRIHAWIAISLFSVLTTVPVFAQTRNGDPIIYEFIASSSLGPNICEIPVGQSSCSINLQAAVIPSTANVNPCIYKDNQLIVCSKSYDGPISGITESNHVLEYRVNSTVVGSATVHGVHQGVTRPTAPGIPDFVISTVSHPSVNPMLDDNAEFTLCWDHAQNSPDRYEWKRRQTNGANTQWPANWTDLSPVSGGGEQCLNESLQIPALVYKYYEYQVRACNAAGCSLQVSYSPEIGLIPADTTGEVINNVRFGADTVNGFDNDGTITILWDPVDNPNLVGYRIDELNLGTSHTTTITSQNPSYTYDRTPLPSRINLNFRVSACYDLTQCNFPDVIAHGNSPPVAIRETSTPAVPTPTSFNGLSSFNPNEDDDGYYRFIWTVYDNIIVDHYEWREIDATTNAVLDSGTTLSGVAFVQFNNNSPLVPELREYRVRACNSALANNGCSSWTPVQTVNHLPGIPNQPTSCTSSSVNSPNYTVNWQGAATGGVAESYLLEESPNGHSGWTAQSLETPLSTQKAYTNKPAGTYHYRVSACNVAGCGSSRNCPTVTVSQIDPPDTPTGLQAVSNQSEQVSVSWSTPDNDPPFNAYDLQESSDNGTSFQAVSLPVATQNSIDLSRSAGTYLYKVAACNSGVCSPYTTNVSVTVTSSSGSDVPQNLRAPAEADGVYWVEWDAPASGPAVTYELEESADSGLTWQLIYKDFAPQVRLTKDLEGTYQYRVLGCDADDSCSAPSNVITVVTTAADYAFCTNYQRPGASANNKSSQDAANDFNAGRWFNLNRPGHGWDFFRFTDDDGGFRNLWALWYTYDNNGDPVWYTVYGPYDANSLRYQGPIWKLSYSLSGEPSQNPPVEVGTIDIRFYPDYPSDPNEPEPWDELASVAWHLFDPQGTGEAAAITYSGEECVEHFGEAVGSGGSSGDGRNGTWMVDQLDGYSINAFFFAEDSTGASNNEVDFEALGLFDASGDPIWWTAQKVNQGPSPDTDTLDVIRSHGYCPGIVSNNKNDQVCDVPDVWLDPSLDPDGSIRYSPAVLPEELSEITRTFGIDKFDINPNYNYGRLSTGFAVPGMGEPFQGRELRKVNNISLIEVSPPYRCHIGNPESSIGCDMTLYWYTDTSEPDASIFTRNLTQQSGFNQGRLLTVGKTPRSQQTALQIIGQGDYVFEMLKRADRDFDNANGILALSPEIRVTTSADCQAYNSAYDAVNSPHLLAPYGVVPIGINTPELSWEFELPATPYRQEMFLEVYDKTNQEIDISKIVSPSQSGDLFSYTPSVTDFVANEFWDKEVRYQWRIGVASACGIKWSEPQNLAFEKAMPDMPMISESALQMPEHDPTIGTTGGSAGVSGGSATYNIPIVIPPGRKGMQPNISLSYNSRGGNGVAGMGWSLSAGSSIHRCPSTPAQDNGVARAVRFDEQDKLCLDGQRLIVVSGQYGRLGAVYRTEIDQFARVTQLGADHHQAASYFEVITKSGLTQYYGGNNLLNDRFARFMPELADGSGQVSAPMTWALYQELDPYNNSTDWFYSDNNSEHLLTSIKYTGNGVTPGTRRVEFTYEDRSLTTQGVTDRDYAISYQAGTLTHQTKRLRHVETFAPNELVRRYTLNYQLSQSSGRSIVTAVSLCAFDAGDTACKPSTVFSYNNHPSSFMPVMADIANLNTTGGAFDPVNLPEPSQSQNVVPQRATPVGIGAGGDLNGDGFNELTVSFYNEEAGTISSYLISGKDLAESPNASIAPLAFSDDHDYFGVQTKHLHHVMKADFNNDGRVDLVGWEIPQGVGSTAYLKIGFWHGASDWSTDTDFSDRFEFVEYNGAAGRGTISTAVGSGNNLPVPKGTIRMADMDADGFIDLVIDEGTNSGCAPVGQRALVWYRNESLVSFGSTRIPTFSPRKLITCLDVTDPIGLTAAVNAELHDFQQVSALQDMDGNGFPDIRIDFTQFLPNSGFNDNRPLVLLSQGLDGNGDLDLTSHKLRNPPATKKRGKEETVCSNGALGIDPYLSNVYHQFGDFNGDGLGDLVYIQQGGGGGWMIQFNTGQSPKGESCMFSPPVETGSAVATQRTCSPGRCPNVTDQQRASWRPDHASSIRIADIDNDGKDELVYPDTIVYKTCGVTGWGGEPNRNEGINEPDFVCGMQLYEYALGWWDNSVYEYGYLDFDVYPEVAAASGLAIETRPIQETMLIASANGLFFGDLNGDGLTDPISGIGPKFKTVVADDVGQTELYPNFVTIPHIAGGDSIEPGSRREQILEALGEQYASSNQTWHLQTCSADPKGDQTCATNFLDPQNRWRRLYVNMNRHAVDIPVDTDVNSADIWLSADAPEMLTESLNGLNIVSRWNYEPLSSIKARDNIDLPLYSIPDRESGDGYLDGDDIGEYFYFASSMRVVSDFEFTDAVGGFNGERYSYLEAVYHARGRGFQGFRGISVDMIYDTDITPNEDEYHRETRSTTCFHQRFPLAGRVENTRTSLRDDADNGSCEASNAQPITQSNQIWTWLGDNEMATKGCDTSLGYPAPLHPNTYVPLSCASSTTSYQLNNRAQRVTETELRMLIDEYANLLKVITETRDYINNGAELLVQDHFEEQEYEYLHRVNNGSWVINQPLRMTRRTDVDYSGRSSEVPLGLTEKGSTMLYVWNDSRQKACEYQLAGPAAITTSICDAGVSSATVARTTFGYDVFGNLESVTSAAHLGGEHRRVTTEFTTDGYFPSSVTNALGHTSQAFVRMRDGQVVTNADPNGLIETFHYDVFGTQTKQTFRTQSGLLRSPSILTAQLDCNGGVADPILACDASESYVMVTRSLGSPWTATFVDQFGRNLRETKSVRTSALSYSQSQTSRFYNAAGEVVFEHTPAFGHGSLGSNYSYDDLGRVVEKTMTTANGCVQQRLYTHRGLVNDIVVDNLGSAVDCEVPTLNISRTYSSQGWLLETMDALLSENMFFYDGDGNILTVADAYGSAAMKSGQSAEQHMLTQADYDNLNRRIRTIDPNQGISEYLYNGFDEVVRSITANQAGQNKATYTEYDQLGRLSRRGADWFNGNAHSMDPLAAYLPTTTLDIWSYDPPGAAGKMQDVRRFVSDGTGAAKQAYSRKHQYDSQARPTDQVEWLNPDDGFSDTFRTRWQYDSGWGRVKAMTYPSGIGQYFHHETIQGDLLRIGNLESVNPANPYSPSTSYWQYFNGYDAWSNLTGESFGNGLDATYQHYEATGQVQRTAVSCSHGSCLQNIQYAYDTFGNLVRQHALDGAPKDTVETYEYDELHRLTLNKRDYANGSSSQITYAYDPIGNITHKSDYAPSYQYLRHRNGGPNAVTDLLNDAGAVLAELSYDSNGNLVFATGVMSMAVTYDSFNKPLTVVRDASNLVGFAYGPDLQRYQQCKGAFLDSCDGDDSGRTMYSLGRSIERTHSGNRIQERTYAGSVVIEEHYDHEMSIHYTHKDRLGSNAMITDHEGLVIQERGFDPFGKSRDGDWTDSSGRLSSTVTPRGFTTHEHLDSVELIHMNGRAFDYTLGRFLSVDPFIQFPKNSQSLNPYSYLLNSPFAGSDPTGYQCEASELDSCFSDLDSGSITSVTNSKGQRVGTIGKDSEGNAIITTATGSSGVTSVGLVSVGASQPSNQATIDNGANGAEGTSIGASADRAVLNTSVSRPQSQSQMANLENSDKKAVNLRDLGLPYDFEGSPREALGFQAKALGLNFDVQQLSDSEVDLVLQAGTGLIKFRQSSRHEKSATLEQIQQIASVDERLAGQLMMVVTDVMTNPVWQPATLTNAELDQALKIMKAENNLYKVFGISALSVNRKNIKTIFKNKKSSLLLLPFSVFPTANAIGIKSLSKEKDRRLVEDDREN